MARYDEHTRKFMEDVSEGDNKKELLTRQGMGVVRDILTSHNKEELPKKLIKRTIGIATTLSEPKIEKTAGLPLFEHLTKKYGDSWHSWEPETLWSEIENPTEEEKNAIQAFQVVVKTNFPFEEWHVFEKVGHAFNANPVHFGQVQPLEMDEVAYTIKVLTLLRPKEEFEDDIKGYIAAAAKEAGMVYLPKNLYPEGCQQFLDKMGNDLALRDLVAKHYPKKSQEETALGIQLARLSEIDDYVRE